MLRKSGFPKTDFYVRNRFRLGTGTRDERPFGAPPLAGARFELGGPRMSRGLRHRSGRVIALARVVLAGVFLAALWVDPEQPVRDAASGYALVGGYLLLSLLALAIAWRSWWWDNRLALPMFFVDVLVFLSAVYFTESIVAEFTSPFLGFFAFLMLETTLRWNWRIGAIAASGIIAAYLLTGLAMDTLGFEFDLQRFGRRTSYMVVLAFILSWFGFERGAPPVPRFDDAPREDELPLSEMGDYARAVSGAECVVIEWTPARSERGLVYRSGGEDEGTLDIFEEGGSPSHAPTHLPCLFDAHHDRRLYRARKQALFPHRTRRRPPFDPPLGVDEGLAIALESAAGRGLMVLSGIDGMGPDFIPLGEGIAREIEAATDRRMVAGLARATALENTRQALARDLHDSVAQSLAAASFRLEALRRWIVAGNDPEPEIAEFKDALRREQKHVRGLIEALRDSGRMQVEKKDLVADLQALVEGLGRFWHVTVDFVPGLAELVVPRTLSHEIQQLVREGIANAVRHGGARRIRIELGESMGQAYLLIRDDGSGIAEDRRAVGPRSIRDRCEALGGTMDFTTGESGTELQIALPIGVGA